MRATTPDEEPEAGWSDVALVVAHPAHAISVAGMVQRYRPQILILGSSPTQEAVVREGLAAVGLQKQATTLAFSDAESYAHVHAGDYRYHAALARQIYDWLSEVRPRVVLGDAFELTQFQHDVGRVLLDQAVMRYRATGRELRNYEFPLSCRIEPGTHNLLYQQFPFGDYETFTLHAGEIEKKRALGEWASQQDAFIAQVSPLIPDIAREPYRAVPENRDYTIPPSGLLKHYDDRGREEVSAGRYARPILFDEYFVPLVQTLCTAGAW